MRCQNKHCPLFRAREVPYAGNRKASLVYIGESPGAKEIIEGVPFVHYAPAGKLIRDVSRKAGLNWPAFFIMNAARCMIAKEQMSGKEITKALACCRPKVAYVLQALAPKAIVVLGDFALRQILRRSGITKSRGRWVWSSEFNCWVMPTFHPAHVCRYRAYERTLIDDLRAVADFVENGYQVKTEADEVDYREVESIKPFVSPGVTVGIDTETQGLDWLDPNFLLVSCSISWAEGLALQVVLYEEGTKDDHDFTIAWLRVPEGKKKEEEVLVYVKRTENFTAKAGELRWMLENPKIKKIMMHGNFDLHAFRRFYREEFDSDVRVENYTMDVQAAAHLIDESVYTMASLEDLQRAFTNYNADYKQDFTGRKDILAVPRDKLTAYACADADVTRRVGLAQREVLLTPSNRVMARYFSKFVMPTLRTTLLALEENGVYVDTDSMPTVKREVEREARAAQTAAQKLATDAIREKHKEKGLVLTRGRFVSDVLFDDKGFKLEPVKRTQSREAWSVDKETRTVLLDRKGLPRKARVFLQRYNEFVDMNELVKKFKNFERHIREDNRMYPSLSLVIAVTGRLSGSKPALMNVPKRSKAAYRIRQIISAPPGWLLLSGDQEQSELRWLAHLANDREMIKVFSERRDIHDETSKSLVPKWEQLSTKEKEASRRNAKSLNFGVIFGMAAKGFVKYAKIEYNIDLSLSEAEKWISIWFRKYSGVPLYHRRQIEFCRKFGYVESPLGRRRRLPEIHSTDKFQRGEAERQAINQPIQSPSSDVVLLACTQLLEKKLLDPTEIRPVLFIHDELVFEVKDNSKIVDYAKVVKYEMENPPLKRNFDLEMRVPFVTEIKVGKNLSVMERI